MLRAYVRPTSRFPAAPQIEACKAAGAKVIYVEGTKENWAALLVSFRKGTKDICVVDGFDRLGDTPIIGRQRLLELAGRGVKVMDARSRSVADPTALARWDEARTSWSGEAKSNPKQAKSRGKKGGKAKAEKFKAELDLSLDEMRTIWLEASSNEEAAQRTGVSARTLHRWFDKSGRTPGFKSGKD